jgi:hypothetical protein
MRKFIEADQSQALLLPPDLREWIPSDDLAHFVLEAVGALCSGGGGACGYVAFSGQ